MSTCLVMLVHVITNESVNGPLSTANYPVDFKLVKLALIQCVDSLVQASVSLSVTLTVDL